MSNREKLRMKEWKKKYNEIINKLKILLRLIKIVMNARDSTISHYLLSRRWFFFSRFFSFGFQVSFIYCTWHKVNVPTHWIFFSFFFIHTLIFRIFHFVIIGRKDYNNEKTDKWFHQIVSGDWNWCSMCRQLIHKLMSFKR